MTNTTLENGSIWLTILFATDYILVSCKQVSQHVLNPVLFGMKQHLDKGKNGAKYFIRFELQGNPSIGPSVMPRGENQHLNKGNKPAGYFIRLGPRRRSDWTQPIAT